MGQCCAGDDQGAMTVQELHSGADDRLESPILCENNVEKEYVSEGHTPSFKGRFGNKPKAPANEVAAQTTPMWKRAPSSEFGLDMRICVLTFEEKSGGKVTECEIELSQSPFGMSYVTNVHPIVMVKFPEGSHAQAAGVRKGMKLTHIDGVDMLNSDFATVDKAIKDASKRIAAFTV